MLSENNSKARLLAVYMRGFILMFLHVAVVSLLLVWVLQLCAIGFGETHDWGAVLVHIFLSLNFLALFPGQTFWTYRISDAEGRIYTIVGNPNLEDDLNDSNM